MTSTCFAAGVLLLALPWSSGAGLHQASASGHRKPAFSLESRGPDRVELRATADDGAAYLSGGCNRLLGPGVLVTLHDYRGDLLQRIDDQSEDVVFEVRDRRQGERSFPGRMHYFAPESAWVTTDPLSPEFLAALAKGDALQLQDAEGRAVASFNLDGVASIVQAMQEVCGPSSQ